MTKVEGTNFNPDPNVQKGTQQQQADNQPIFNNKSEGNAVIIIKPGDTLSEIADKYNTTVEEIMRLNGAGSNMSPNAFELRVGQSLTVPLNTISEELAAKRRHAKRLNRESEMYQKYDDDPVKKAEKTFQQDLVDGRLKYVEPGKILGFKTGDYYLYYTEDEGVFGVETYGEVKRRYRIADGVLRENNGDIRYGRGGNLDNIRITKHFIIIPPEAINSRK